MGSCVSCGSTLRDGAAFCDQCGVATATAGQEALRVAATDSRDDDAAASGQLPLRWNDWLVVAGAAFAAFVFAGPLLGLVLVAVVLVPMVLWMRRPGGYLRFSILAGLAILSMARPMRWWMSPGNDFGGSHSQYFLLLFLLPGLVILVGAFLDLRLPPKQAKRRRQTAIASAPDQGQLVMARIVPADPGPPGIGIAGFVLSLLGVSAVGIVLSWVGYAQAKREGRRTGLCLAGIIIGFVWLLAVVVLYVILFAVVGTSGSAY